MRSRAWLWRSLPRWVRLCFWRVRAWIEHAYREIREHGRPLWLYVNGSDQVVARSPWEAHRIVLWEGGLDEDDVQHFEPCAPDRVFKVLNEDAPHDAPVSMTPADIVRECNGPTYWWSTEW